MSNKDRTTIVCHQIENIPYLLDNIKNFFHFYSQLITKRINTTINAHNDGLPIYQVWEKVRGVFPLDITFSHA